MSSRPRAVRRVGRPATLPAGLTVLAALAVVLSGCSLFGGDDDTRGGGELKPVFEVGIGTCALAPTKVEAQVTEVETVDCGQSHDLEAYAKPGYTAVEPGTDLSVFPGEQVLDDFAQGACAQAYTDYVGIPYAESDYFFTYLLPSARSWETAEQRYVLCFVSTIGEQVEKSLKGAGT